MTNFSRYAIYYAPPEGDYLSEFTASWFGWNPHRGTKVSYLKLNDLNFEISAITKNPRRYGFHGTLKAPFFLIRSRTVKELKLAILKLSLSVQKVEIKSMILQNLNGFVVITPAMENKAIGRLAKKCVEELDLFREPEPIKKMQMRRSKGLSKSEERLLQKWGYPYVLENFKFHLTMSGKLKPEASQNVIDVLTSELQPVLKKPLLINQICLFGENIRHGNFEIIEKFQLAD